MAFLQQGMAFDVDAFSASVIGIAANVGRHDSGLHQHNRGQLLYAPQGCMSFELEQAICILPPTKAVWIPPHTPHRAVMTNVVAYRSLYFDCSRFSTPTELTMVDVNPLLKALIDKMAHWLWDTPEAQMNHSCALFWEEFYAATSHSFRLAIPSDRRFHGFHQELLTPDFLPPDIGTLAQTIGASAKTVTRLFRADTGMSYQEWRQQWRLLKAIELLSSPLPVTEVGFRLGFSSDSAFIAFFKQHTGQTPRSFIHG
ncbi:AraC family transcriptional regulator [Shewanella zhuhaiensis]|nr:helix-turn-helix transcriptional regulator [Shewanella zhuhaiensis]